MNDSFILNDARFIVCARQHHNCCDVAVVNPMSATSLHHWHPSSLCGFYVGLGSHPKLDSDLSLLVAVYLFNDK
jgi:hypothetical protein